MLAKSHTNNNANYLMPEVAVSLKLHESSLQRKQGSEDSLGHSSSHYQCQIVSSLSLQYMNSDPAEKLGPIVKALLIILMNME